MIYHTCSGITKKNTKCKKKCRENERYCSIHIYQQEIPETNLENLENNSRNETIIYDYIPLSRELREEELVISLEKFLNELNTFEENSPRKLDIVTPIYEREEYCCICFESLENCHVPLLCGHFIHEQCIIRTGKNKCVLCTKKALLRFPKILNKSVKAINESNNFRHLNFT